MKRKHKGAHSELRACLWLLDQGYEVFRNISPCGHADLIAWRGDEILKIDVKTVSRGITTEGSRPRLFSKQVKDGVVALYVLPKGYVVCELDKSPRISPDQNPRCRAQTKKFFSQIASNGIALIG
jgi:hypothetical protein